MHGAAKNILSTLLLECLGTFDCRFLSCKWKMHVESLNHMHYSKKTHKSMVETIKVAGFILKKTRLDYNQTY